MSSNQDQYYDPAYGGGGGGQFYVPPRGEGFSRPPPLPEKPGSSSQQQFANLQSNVKLPPSLQYQHPPQQQQQRAQSMTLPPPIPPRSPTHHPPPVIPHTTQISTRPTTTTDSQLGGVGIPDIVHKLNFASNENVRLRETVQHNNDVLAQIELCLRNKETENGELKKKLEELNKSNDELIKKVEVAQVTPEAKMSDATNRFFEARVAVMGYKCRSMQLQGELEDARAKLRDMTSSSSSSSSASAQQLGSLSAAAATTATPNNAHLSSEIERLREELKQKQAVVDRLTSGDSSSYIRELEQQRKVLSNDKKSQEAIARQLGEDLQSINNKKRLAEDDVERLTTSNHQLQQQMATMNGSYLALQGQMGQLQTEYQERVQRLENELGISQQHRSTELQSVRDQLLYCQGESDLLRSQLDALAKEKETLFKHNKHLESLKEQAVSKCKELEMKKDIMSEKLQKSVSSEKTLKVVSQEHRESTSISSTEGYDQLVEEKRQLQQDLHETREGQRRAQQAREFAEGELQKVTEKAHELDSLNAKLQKDLSGSTPHQPHVAEEVGRLRMQVGDLLNGLGQKDDAISLLNRDKVDLQMRCSQIEREKEQQVEVHVAGLKRENVQLSAQIASLTEQVKLSSQQRESFDNPRDKLTSMRSKADMNLSIRLNEAMGQIKKLQVINTGLEEENRKTTDLRQEIAGLHQSCQQLQLQMQEYVARERDAKGRTEQLRVQLSQSEESVSQMVLDKLSLQNDIDRYRSELTRKDDSERSLERRAMEKSDEVQQLQQRNEDMSAELRRQSEKIRNLQDQYTKLRQESEREKAEKVHLESTHHHVSTQLHTLETEKRGILAEKLTAEVEKTKLQEAYEELGKESESILHEYDECAKRLRGSEGEKDHFKTQFENSLRELDTRTKRIQTLEKQRDEAQERTKHMDAQLKVYHEDFEREREAREAAVHVKSIVEEKMKKMETELQELRKKCNQQALVSMQKDNEYGDPPASVLRAPYHQETPPGSSATPPSFHPGRGGGGGASGAPRSQELIPRRTSDQQYSPAPSPLPPSGYSPNTSRQQQAASEGLAAAGGGGGGGGMMAQTPRRTPDQGMIGAGGGGSGFNSSGGGGGGTVGGGGPSRDQLVGVGHAAPLRSRYEEQQAGGGGMAPHVRQQGGLVRTPPQSEQQQQQHTPQQSRIAPQYAAAPPSSSSSSSSVSPSPSQQPPQSQWPPQQQQQPVGSWTTQVPTTYNQVPPTRPRPITGGQPAAATDWRGGGGRGGGGGGESFTNAPPPSIPPRDHQEPPQVSRPLHHQQQQHSPPTMRNNLGNPGAGAGNGGDPLNVEPPGGRWLAPGEVLNVAPPLMACPICSRTDFQTQTDLEMHCASCSPR